jgi:hypothetical protein
LIGLDRSDEAIAISTQGAPFNEVNQGTLKNKISKTFVVTDQRSRTVNVGVQAFTPTDIFLSVEPLDDLYFAIP